jgi:hypothetical protein
MWGKRLTRIGLALPAIEVQQFLARGSDQRRHNLRRITGRRCPARIPGVGDHESGYGNQARVGVEQVSRRGSVALRRRLGQLRQA